MFRGLLRGEHATRRRGLGLDFSDYRRYQPGDDFRHIDWNIFSRLDRLFLKLYTADEDLTLHVLIDTSASMGFGEPSKFDYARRLAAALAYIGLASMDRVGITAFADAAGASLPPVKARHRITSMLAFLRELRCAGTTRYGDALGEFAARARSPGLVVVLSDLLGGDDARLGLDAVRQGGHDVVALQLLGEDEIDPPLEGALRLVDAENGDELRVTVDRELRAAYRRRLGQALDAIETHCRRRGIEYLRASTAIPFEDVVLRYLRQGAFLR